MANRKDEGGGDLPGAWAAYGRLLQHLRKRAGLNQQQFGEAIGYSLEQATITQLPSPAPQVGSVEQGRRPAKAAFTRAADRVLEAGGVLEVLQDEVDRAKLPRFFRNFALMEAEAVSRFDYEPQLVPGLLQTEEYARALFAGHCPPLGEDVIDQRTEARLSRQKLPTRLPLAELSFIINEEALRDPVGCPEVMRAQWLQLLELAALRNVEVQVMPAMRGFHPGKNGPFVVVETREHKHLGYFESQGVGCVLTEPAEVSTFALRYGKLRSQALNVEESARLIERMAGET
ncbi:MULTISPECIES: helix-turn-helix transcriptional regulator [Streptomyces]|uniref:Helix-turn-helix domain-containing protein n=1 Tax=Streptomyces griseoaurantiacus TaxID=68213 RepID=A0ABZ1VD26_9ACTN|nr:MULTISPECIES: helix-turn-helix transcriptional regulator [Streptomyces]MDX3358341.1 helix-turn-helix transcriptional regulator [Streptomyces sp. ME02-6978.2a]